MTTCSCSTDSDVPLPALQTDERGLLRGVHYVYLPNGAINWRAMIEPQFLAVKKENEEFLAAQHGTTNMASIDRAQIPDHMLLVLLGGWKRLLWLRGYTSLTNPCTFVTPEKAVATCTITFAPTYETRMQAVTYSWTASASYANTSGEIAQSFLEATACNRAFSLCLRGFLNIGIVGKDEMGPTLRATKEHPPQSVPAPARPASFPEPQVRAETGRTAESPPPQAGFQGKDTLAKRCHESGLSFERLKAGAIKTKAALKSDPSTWTSFEDIPSLDAFVLLDRVTRSAEKAKAKV